MKKTDLLFTFGLSILLMQACNFVNKPTVVINHSDSTVNFKIDSIKISDTVSNINSQTISVVDTPVTNPKNKTDKNIDEQIIEERVDRKQPYSLPIYPSFIGGDKALIDFINKNMEYPEAAKKANVSGSVLISFIVKTTGELINVKVEKGIGSGCDEEAIRIIKLMPYWKPGKYNGKAIDMQFSIPVNFYFK